MTRVIASWVAIAGLYLAACGDAEPEPSPPSNLPGDAVVVAEVDGQRFSEYDLTAYITATLGSRADAVDESARREALEGLIATHLMAQKREAEMTDLQRAKVERAVAAFRRQLLARDYIAEHAPPKPVTAAEVAEYYERHADQFGSRVRRRYEVVQSTREIDSGERAKLVAELAKLDLDGAAEWANLANQLQRQGFPMTFGQGRLDDGALHPKLVATARALPIRRASAPLFVDGRAFIVRVVSEAPAQGPGLDAVRGDIRKRLAAVHIRDSVAKLHERALESADIQYQPSQQAND